MPKIVQFLCKLIEVIYTFLIGYKMVFFSHISPVFLLRSSAMQCKKAKIWKKNHYFSLQSKKFKPLHSKKFTSPNKVIKLDT